MSLVSYYDRISSPTREISSSRHAALETAQLLYRFVGAAKFASIEQLIGMIKDVGARLVAANPKGESSPLGQRPYL
jgi:translation initiation factor 2B subunit (eIF-2B alpha/beta/delta family)